MKFPLPKLIFVFGYNLGILRYYIPFNTCSTVNDLLPETSSTPFTIHSLHFIHKHAPANL